jgi:hypothetical protein
MAALALNNGAMSSLDDDLGVLQHTESKVHECVGNLRFAVCSFAILTCYLLCCGEYSVWWVYGMVSIVQGEY